MGSLFSFLCFFAVASKLQYVFVDGIDSVRKSRKKKNNWFQRIVFHSIGSFALHWNRMSFHNAEVIDSLLDEGRSCLLLGYHSRCTTDILLVLCGIQPKLIVTHLFFKVPLVSQLLYLIGFLPSKTSKHAQDEDEAFFEHLSQTEDPLMLLPGGIYEAMKPYHMRYKVHWKGVPGYARVIGSRIKSSWRTKGLSVVPFYTKNSEEFYYSSPFWHDYSAQCFYYFYNAMKSGNLAATPFALTWGLLSLGMVITPRAVPLDTVFGAPVPWEDDDTPEGFNQKVVKALQELIEKTNDRVFPDKISRRDPLQHVSELQLQ